MNKYLIIIPARKNSKRLEKKNISDLNHIPLIEHTIKFANNFKKNNTIETEIIVTTDIIELQELCLKYNIKFHKRKNELCSDEVHTIDVLVDVLENYEKNTTVILLQPTSPIREEETLNNMIKLFNQKNDTVICVEKINNPRYGKIKNDIYIPLNYKIGERSQEIEDIYRENGNIYIYDINTLLNNKLYKNNFFVYNISDNESIDIDYKNDLILANEIIKNKNVNSIEKIKINKRYIGLDEPCFIIAEACDNHMGNFEYAKKMVDIAYLSGVDAVKFQHHLPDEEMLRDNIPMSNNFKEPLYDILKKYSLTLEQHRELKSYCDKLDIIYMCTPFSAKASDEIEDLVDIFKIGSGELTDHPTLIHIAKKGKSMIISTGMSNIDEIEETLEILRPYNNKLMIMNCTSEYPPNYKDININLIPKLKERLGIIVGHSDHTPDNYTCFAAVACGAKIIEKHFIINKLMPGPDQNVSIDPYELNDLVNGIRKIEDSLGNDKNIHELEKPIKLWARRSIVTIKDIKKGEKFSLDNLWCKRPGTGIPSKNLFNIIDKKAKIDIKKDNLVLEEHINY